MAWLFGRNAVDGWVDVEVVYEPPQLGLETRFLLMPDPHSDKVQTLTLLDSHTHNTHSFPSPHHLCGDALRRSMTSSSGWAWSAWAGCFHTSIEATCR